MLLSSLPMETSNTGFIKITEEETLQTLKNSNLSNLRDLAQVALQLKSGPIDKKFLWIVFLMPCKA